MELLQIAIDGPVAAGKGSVSRMVAEKLGIMYVDTGATYRTAALIAIREGMDFSKLEVEDGEEVGKLLEKVVKSEFRLEKASQDQVNQGRLISMFLEGEDVSEAIRGEEVSRKVPVVAKIGRIREIMVEKQREMAVGKSVVMEGRDIASKVLPQAKIKIFLDADVETRVTRRYEQLIQSGNETSVEDVRESLVMRDKLDQERQNDPLVKTDEMWHLDTTNKSINEVVSEICGKARTIDELG